VSKSFTPLSVGELAIAVGVRYYVIKDLLLTNKKATFKSKTGIMPNS
jgi:hypothetical protein